MEHEVCAYCGEQITGQPFIESGKTYCDSNCAEQAAASGDDDYE